MEKISYCSLEFIVGEHTYWLRSNCAGKTKDPYFLFVKLPKVLFLGKELIESKLISPHTGMYVLSKQGLTRRYLMFDSGGPPPENYVPDLNFDLEEFETIRWQDMFWFLRENGYTTQELTSFWIRHIVQTKDEESKEQTKYVISEFLPSQGGLLSFMSLGQHPDFSISWDISQNFSLKGLSLKGFDTELKKLEIVSIFYAKNYWYV
ncbi:MAG: hypothetical protein SGJ02_12810 [bacterium]|nr:hypothetical protein [bacterium]